MDGCGTGSAESASRMAELFLADPRCALAATFRAPGGRAAGGRDGGARAANGEPSGGSTDDVFGVPVTSHVRAVLAAGGLSSRSTLAGEPMVLARDTAGRSWWIAARAVWADVTRTTTDPSAPPVAAAPPVASVAAGDGVPVAAGGDSVAPPQVASVAAGDGAALAHGPSAAPRHTGTASQRPVHPHAVGLAVGSSRALAMLAGLSDRLGWEAVADLADDGDPITALPPLGPAARAELVADPAASTAADGGDVRLLDGRHTAVPTIVMVGDGVLRWGAGATWLAALRRALFGDAGVADDATAREELETMAAQLAQDGIIAAGVDLGTPTLDAAGITRLSVQLLLADG